MKSILLSSAALIASGRFRLCPRRGDDRRYAHRSQHIEYVTVTATRVATPVSQVASSVTVITAADIDARQQRSLPDVLRSVPGLDIVQTGGAGGQTSLFMRGTNSNHTKVLLDGIDIADPSTPNGVADISKLLAGDIARVEVLRGPQSGALWLRRHRRRDQHHHQERRGAACDSRPMPKAAVSIPSTSALRLSGSEGAFHYAATVQHFHSGATPGDAAGPAAAGRKAQR